MLCIVTKNGCFVCCFPFKIIFGILTSFPIKIRKKDDKNAQKCLKYTQQMAPSVLKVVLMQITFNITQVMFSIIIVPY